MHIVTIAWIFVVVLMAAAEATSTQGTLLGAFFTLLLYGLLPLSIVLYLIGTPARRQARRRTEAAEAQTAASPVDGQAQAQPDPASSAAGDASGEPPSDGRSAVRKEA